MTSRSCSACKPARWRYSTDSCSVIVSPSSMWPGANWETGPGPKTSCRRRFSPPSPRVRHTTRALRFGPGCGRSCSTFAAGNGSGARPGPASSRCRMRKRRIRPAITKPVTHDTALAILLRTERREQVHRLLTRLPEPQADALRLRFFGDLQFSEIALAMGSSPSVRQSKPRQERADGSGGTIARERGRASMNCDTAFDLMTDAEGAGSLALANHLAGCPRCRQMQETLAPALEFLNPQELDPKHRGLCHRFLGADSEDPPAGDRW